MSFDLQIRPIWSWTKDMEETGNLKESGLFLANNLLVEGQTQSKTNRLPETEIKIGIGYHSLLELQNYHY